MKTHTLALHIFRRDLRLQDNTALIEALKLSEQVIPCFIFDKRQIECNDYKSDNAIQFMAHSLQELDAALKEKQSRLYFFYGTAEEVLAQLIATLPLQAVFVNRDYTPFSRVRDQKMETVCKHNRIAFYSYADALLQEPEQVTKKNDEPYTLFTPFFKTATRLPVQPPQKNRYANYYQASIPLEDKQTLQKLLQKTNPNLSVKGGRQEALKLLKKAEALTNYKKMRDFPALDGTTRLSAHHKFGTLSIRESYATALKTFGKQHQLITEFYWRDFFTHIAFHYPRVLGGAFHAKYDALPWRNNEKQFRLWCEGRTGFPLVDAGMRELNTTGFMHNRVRMVTASFLIKDLLIDWRWGEKYFAQKLVDYDPAVNNGNWQWAASTGCDAQPYFRIFNPWLQQQKFDPDCLYIKRWVPELARLTAKTIHALDKNPPPPITHYPSPLVNHSLESKKTKILYKKIS
mgnify:CR=1 FL=1